MNAELKLAAEGNTDALRQWLRAHPDRINITYGVSQYTLLYTTVLHSNKVALASLASGTNIYLDTVRMLCEEFHADAGAPNGGSHNTVVHLAADMEAIEILRYLLFDYHAPLLRNVFNETPLDVAVRAGKAKAIALLKQRMSELEAEGKSTQGNNNNATAMTNNNNSSSGSGSNSGSTSTTPTPTRYDPTQISDALLLGGAAAGGRRPGTGNGTTHKQNKKAAYHNKKEGKLSNAEQYVSASGVTSGEGNATRGQGAVTTAATPTHKYHKEKSERLPMMPTAATTVVSAPENVHRPMRRHAHSTLQSHFATTTTAMGSTPPNLHYSLQLQPTRPPFHEEEEREEECDVVQPVTSGTPSYNNYTTSNSNGAVVKRASSSLGSCHRRISITDTTTTTMDEEAPDPPRTRPSTSQPLSPAQTITTPCPPPPALPHHLRHHRSRTAQQVHQPKERGGGEEVAVEALAQGSGTIWGNVGMSQTPPAVGQTLHRHVSGMTASRSADASLSLRERVAELRIQDDDDDDEEDNEAQQQQQHEAEKDTGAEGGNTRRAVTTYDEHTTAGSSSGVGAKPLRRSATENATRHVINVEANNNYNVRVEGENLVTLSAAQGTTMSQASPPLHHRTTLPNNCPSAPLHMCAVTLARHEVDWSSCTNFESNDLRSFRAAFGNAYRITACRDHCEIKGYLAYRFKGGEYYAPVIIGIYSGRPSEQSPQTTTTNTTALNNSPHSPSTGLTLTTTSSDRADVDHLTRPNHNAIPNTPPNAMPRNASSATITTTTTTSASSSSSHSYSRYRVMLNTELLGPYGIHRRAAYIDPLSKAIIVSPCDRTYTGLVAFLREAIIKNFQTMPPMVASGRPSACPFYLPIHRIDTNAESDKTEKLMKPVPNAHVNKSSSYIRDALPHRTQAQVRRYRILQDLSRFGDGYFNYIAAQHCVDGVLPIFRETSVSAQGTTTTSTSSLTSSYRVLYPIVGHMMEFFPSHSAAPVHYTVPHASAANESVDVSQLKLVELLLYLRIRVQFTSLSSTTSSSSNSSAVMNLYDGVPVIFLMDGRANRFMEACFARLLLPAVNHHPTTNNNSNMDTHVTPCEVDSRQLSHLLEHWNTTGSLFDLLVELRNMLTQCVKEYLTSYSAHSITAYPSSASITSTASPLQNLFPPNATSTTTTTMPALHSGGNSDNNVVVPLNESPATAALAAFFTPTPNPVPLAGTHTSPQQQQQQQVYEPGMQDWFATNTTTQGASNGMHFFSSGRPISSHEHNMQGCDGGGLTSAQMGSPMQGHTGMNVGGNTLYTLRCVRCKREGVAKNAVLLPCYHVALCEECVAQYQNHCRHGEFACPVCYSVVRAAYALGLST